MKKLKKVSIIICLLIITISFFGCVENSEKFTPKEQAIYDLVLKASYEFKSPQSVRILSGTVDYFDSPEVYGSEDETQSIEDQHGYYIYANLTLSATNSYGASQSKHYNLHYNDDGSVSVTDLDWLYDEMIKNGDNYSFIPKNIEEAKKTDDFDIDKINKALSEKWKNY